MVAEPARAVTQQLFDFVVADPIMLLVVERRDQHVEMREQIAQAAMSPQFDSEVLALAPFWRSFVQAAPPRRHRVAYRFEQPPQNLLPAATGQNGDRGLQRQLSLDQ